MNNTARIVVGVLIAIVVGLGIAVGVMATRDNQDSVAMGSHMGGTDDGYQGMMGAMGSMDSEAMLGHMREILGEDGYNRMMQHLQDHRDGMTTGDAGVDGMMHQMMDGMMQHMPADSQDILPPDVDQHHEPPVAGTPAN